MPTEIEKAYLAGVMDSDGCIGIYVGTSTRRSGKKYRHHALRVTLKQVRPEAINLMERLYGGRARQTPQRGNSKPQWDLQYGSTKAYDVLLDLATYMRIKHAQAMLGIAYYEEVQNQEQVNAKGWAAGRIGLSDEIWQRREEFRLAMFALNSGALGVTSNRAGAETEWKGARKIVRVKRQSALTRNRKRSAETTDPGNPAE